MQKYSLTLTQASSAALLSLVLAACASQPKEDQSGIKVNQAGLEARMAQSAPQAQESSNEQAEADEQEAADEQAPSEQEAAEEQAPSEPSEDAPTAAE